MNILIDQREKTPWTFTAYPDVTATVCHLPTGDYCLAEYPRKIGIERKTLADLAGSLSTNRERFLREMDRAADFEQFFVVVEGSLVDVTAGRYRARIHPNAFLGSVASITVKRGIPFLWCGGRGLAGQTCLMRSGART